MSDAEKIDLVQIKNRLARLAEIKGQIRALTKEQEELLEYFRGLNHVLKELQDGLDYVRSMSGLNITNDSPVQALGLPTRIINCLIFENIRTIEQLLQKTAREIYMIPNLGRRSINILQGTLDQYGLKLADHSH